MVCRSNKLNAFSLWKKKSSPALIQVLRRRRPKLPQRDSLNSYAHHLFACHAIFPKVRCVTSEKERLRSEEVTIVYAFVTIYRFRKETVKCGKITLAYWERKCVLIERLWWILSLVNTGERCFLSGTGGSEEKIRVLPTGVEPGVDDM